MPAVMPSSPLVHRRDARLLRCDAFPIRTPSAFPKGRSEEHTSELQSLMRISYAVFCLKKKNNKSKRQTKVDRHTYDYRSEHSMMSIHVRGSRRQPNRN